MSLQGVCVRRVHRIDLEVPSNQEDCLVDVIMGIPLGLQLSLDTQLHTPLVIHPWVVEDGSLHWRHVFLWNGLGLHGEFKTVVFETMRNIFLKL
jgi:hypothetical protein